MNIAIMADSRKYELLMNFCIAYKQILKKHQLMTPFYTASLIQEASGLEPTALAVDRQESVAQLASRARYNEIDAVIYLRDPDLHGGTQASALLQACDHQAIPYASNIATAEILVLAIDRGDLDWRELVR